MLFWGQQGVSPNLQAAVKYYKAGARKEENPVSMYDYAIVLLKVRILLLLLVIVAIGDGSMHLFHLDVLYIEPSI